MAGLGSIGLNFNIFQFLYRNKGGICIPNSKTEVWTMIDSDLLN